MTWHFESNCCKCNEPGLYTVEISDVPNRFTLPSKMEAQIGWYLISDSRSFTIEYGSDSLEPSHDGCFCPNFLRPKLLCPNCIKKYFDIKENNYGTQL